MTAIGNELKVLFVGYHNPHFMSFTEYVECAIRNLGHTVETFDYRDWLVPGRIRDRIPLLHSMDIKRINNKLVRRVRKFQPDLLLVSGGWTIFPETISLIRSLSNTITVNWIADFPLKFDVYLKAGPHYHFFFASGTDALKKYQEAGHKNGYWLPFACNPEVHRPVDLTTVERDKNSCDICFVGSNYIERIEILENLCDFDLGIWGPGWERLPQNSPLRRFVRGRIADPQEWVKIFSASKIVLNIIGHRTDVMEPLVEKKDFRIANTRVFEILGCGAFELVDAKEDVKTLFRNKEHLVMYKNAEELRNLVRFYLENPEERIKIAQKGQKEILKKHTYRHRIEELLSVVQRNT